MRDRLARAWRAARENWVRALAASGLVAFFFGNQGCRSLVGNWLELRRLRAEITSLETEEARLNERLKALRGGDAVIERMARKELGFIRKGELEYRFEPPVKKEP